MNLAGRLLFLRLEWAMWRAERRQRRQTERELASYCTPSQRDDIGATLDRYPDAETAHLRDVLARQAFAHHRAMAWKAMTGG